MTFYTAKCHPQVFFAILDEFFISGEALVIKCHLARLMGERKMKIVDVARETGLNRNTVTLLYKETSQRIDLDALERLCKLFGCGVGDLLEYVED